MEKSEKIIGKIIKVHPAGWGFIISSERKFTKFFFHWTALVQGTNHFNELTAGSEVKFIPITEGNIGLDNADKGPKAIQIEIIKLYERKEEVKNESKGL